MAGAGHIPAHEANHTVNDISEAVELIVSRNGSLRVRR
jgi:hypothetical protein